MSEEQKTIQVLTRALELLLNQKETNVLPPALEKALTDRPWDYMIGLRDGRTVRFKGAEMYDGGGWITLLGSDDSKDNEIDMLNVSHSFPRGLDIRISDIMWATDAPGGS